MPSQGSPAIDYFSPSRSILTRFYFSSSADLLDILSKGNQPLMVAKHLTKLFDSMAKLLMEEDGEGKVTNTAHTMVAKDGEKVVFKVGLTITLIIFNLASSWWQGGVCVRGPGGGLAQPSDDLHEGDHSVSSLFDERAWLLMLIC